MLHKQREVKCARKFKFYSTRLGVSLLEGVRAYLFSQVCDSIEGERDSIFRMLFLYCDFLRLSVSFFVLFLWLNKNIFCNLEIKSNLMVTFVGSARTHVWLLHSTHARPHALHTRTHSHAHTHSGGWKLHMFAFSLHCIFLICFSCFFLMASSCPVESAGLAGAQVGNVDCHL